MEFLVSTTAGWGVCRDGKVTPVETDGKYFGLTWDEEFIYAVRVLPVKGDNDNIIRRYDRSFNRVDSFTVKNLCECHQIYCCEGRIYATNTRHGRIDVIDPKSGEVERTTTWPGLNRASHLNSIFRDEGGWWFVGLHSGGNSRVVRVGDRKGWNLGSNIHNVYVEGNLLHVCDSNNQQVLIYDTTKKSVVKKIGIPKGTLGHQKWWPRGLACTEDRMLVGLSMKMPRNKRHLGYGGVVEIDHNHKITKAIKITGSGAVNDVRLISEPDLAHNGVDF